MGEGRDSWLVNECPASRHRRCSACCEGELREESLRLTSPARGEVTSARALTPGSWLPATHRHPVQECREQ